MADERAGKRPSGGASSDVVHMVPTGDGRVRYERRCSDGSTVVHDYGRPFILELEVTWRCNLRCMHCYVDATEGARCDELTLAELRRVIEDGAAIGMMEKLVTVSLDSATPAVHDAIRGRECHGTVVAAIRRLRAADIPVSVITAFCRDNLDEFDGLFRFCSEHGVDWQVQMTSAKGRCPRERVFGPDEYYELGRRVAGAIAARPPFNIIPMDDLATFSRFEPLSLLSRTWQCGCSGGQLNIFVRADGSVTPCSAISFPPFVVGNVRETSLQDVCRERRCHTCLQAWLDVAALEGACAKCPHRQACRGGCPEILWTMCDGRHENRYCYWRIEEERIQACLDGIW